MSHDTTPTSHTSETALARLVEGNERFLRGEARFPEGVMKRVGAMFEFSTGRARFLD
jgi:hypothetical protein